MSVDASPSAGLLTAPGGLAARAIRALGERARAGGLPLQAFVYSRMIVLLAGVGGALMVAKRAPAATVSTAMHQLGPVGYVLAGSVDRFDSGYYLAVAQHGYGTLASGQLAFFPLYPLLIRAMAVFTRSYVVAGVAVSGVAFVIALVLLRRLTELELGARAADATVLLIAFAPLSVFFTAIYTESLFLALSVATVLAARRDRWALACALGSLATLTRPTGILLAVAIVVMRLRTHGSVDRRLAWVLALPATLLGYMTFLAASGHPWLGLFQAQAQWQRVTTGPLAGLASAVWAAIRGATRIAGGAPIYHPALTGPFTQSAESVILLGVLAITCAALALCLRRLPLEYGVYAAVVIVFCLSSPEVGQPLWSFDRFALTIFPLWMAAGAWVAKRRLEAPAVVLGSILLVFYTVQFSSWAFVA
jgi:Mannosyltransferase (PIG-V)